MNASVGCTPALSPSSAVGAGTPVSPGYSVSTPVPWPAAVSNCLPKTSNASACAAPAAGDRLWKKTPEVIAAIEAALQHDVAGDPITGIRWTRRTTEKTILNHIRTTATDTGLCVTAQLVDPEYPKGAKISDAQFASIAPLNLIRSNRYETTRSVLGPEPQPNIGICSCAAPWPVGCSIRLSYLPTPFPLHKEKRPSIVSHVDTVAWNLGSCEIVEIKVG